MREDKKCISCVYIFFLDFQAIAIVIELGEDFRDFENSTLPVHTNETMRSRTILVQFIHQRSPQLLETSFHAHQRPP